MSARVLPSACGRTWESEHEVRVLGGAASLYVGGSADMGTVLPKAPLTSSDWVCLPPGEAPGHCNNGDLMGSLRGLAMATPRANWPTCD